MLASIALLAMPPRMEKISLTIDGVERTAWAILPETPSAHPPLVIGFHGHGGTAFHFAQQMRFSQSWKDAIVIYPQGLPAKTPVDPEGKENGWLYPTADGKDRELDFVDALLSYANQKWGTLARSTFAVGHSNGGAMTYALWRWRPQDFAGFCVMAGPPQVAEGIAVPKPAFLIAGQDDPLVLFNRQMVEANSILSLIGLKSRTIDSKIGIEKVTSPSGIPFWIDKYAGGHKPPADAGSLVMSFFKSIRQ